jgi:16S rRNA processing protein RimM
MDKPSLVSVGKVVGAHGVRGAVKIVAYGESFGACTKGDRLSLKSAGKGKEIEALTLVSSSPHGRVWLAQFEEIQDRDTAKGMVGREILIDEDRLPQLVDGEYYYYQLIGLPVERVDGTVLGALTGIIEAGSHDVYVIKDGEKEYLIPAIDEVVREIDLQKRRVVVDPPEGLLE